jgi:hypothetical protein
MGDIPQEMRGMTVPEQAVLGWLESLRSAVRHWPGSGHRLLMHLDRNSMAEGRQGGFETGQAAGGTRVDEARRLAVVYTKAAG